MTFVAFSLNDAYSMKISCADNVDLEEFPICNYISEWNESEKFDEKVLAELTIRADEINENPELFSQIYQETLNKVNRDNSGLEEKSQKLRELIYNQIKNE